MPKLESSIYAHLCHAVSAVPPKTPPSRVDVGAEQLKQLDYVVSYEVLIVLSQGRLNANHLSSVINALRGVAPARACSLLQARRLNLPSELALKHSGTWQADDNRSIVRTPAP